MRCMELFKRRSGRLVSLTSLIVILTVPQAAWSNNDDDSFVLNRDGKRFYSLTPARNGVPTGLVKSDAQTIRKGFFPLDRKVLVAPTRAVSVLPYSPRASSENKQNNKANNERADNHHNDAKILTLFGDNVEINAPENAAQNAQSFGGLLSRGVKAITHIWPLPANIAQHISSGFGMRKDPFTGKPAFHSGIDIAAAKGAPVLASASGIVKEAGRKGGYGNYVLLSHIDGTQTMYSHLQSINVRVGNGVQAGQTIGALGSTGRSTGAHLDYRLIAAGKKYNPMQILAGKEPKNLGTQSLVAELRGAKNTTFASAVRPSVRVESGVRIITPRERLAQAGGFIRVR